MQFDANTKNKQLLQSCLTKYTQQSLKAWEGQTYIIGEYRLYKALVHADGGGGGIQEVYQRIFFIRIAFILNFVKSKGNSYEEDSVVNLLNCPPPTISMDKGFIEPAFTNNVSLSFSSLQTLLCIFG